MGFFAMCHLRTFGYWLQPAVHGFVDDMKTLYSEKTAVLLALLREKRLAAGMTQLDLATALGEVLGPTGRTTVTKVELGVRRLDPVEAFEWARCLGMTFTEFAAALEERLIALEVRNSGGRRRIKNA